MFWSRRSPTRTDRAERGGSNLEAKRKRLSIVFATLFATKQGVQGASVSSDTARLCDWCGRHRQYELTKKMPSRNPEISRINTQDWTKGTQSIPRGYIYSTSDIYFDDAAVEEFEKKLSSDTKWISTIPNDMVGITSYFCDIQTGDYYIIYNRDTGEFNKLPSKSGTYVFINVLYNAESNTMKLVEYKIEYTK